MEKINKYGLGSNNRELVVTDKYGNVKSIFQNKIALTTLGSSGPSTFINNVLNIPNYSTALSGYVPNSRTLTINGTTYDLSANRTWNVGTVTAVTASAPLSSSGGTTPNITIPQANISTSGFLSFTDWNTFNSKQPAGNYITALSGEATGSGPGTASVTLNNASVTAKVLTGVNVTGGSINASDSILTAFGKLQNQINGLIGSSIYQGTWNALTNTPALTSGVGTRGYYYIVNVAGSTNLDGITDWNVGDWAIFDGTAWQQVDNTDSVTSVNGQTGAVSLTSDNIPEGVTNLYFTNLRARQSISLTTLGTGGLSTYDNTTGVLNIPNYSTALGGYVPYIGATQNVNLGEFGLTAGQLTLDVSPTGTAVVGTTRWNNTIGSSETTLKGGSVILKNGVDLVARVVNKVSPNTTLTKAGYAAVRVSGAQGQRLAVAYAQADSDANSADTIGLVTETIATNQEGFIITVGHLEDINTTGSLQGETWVDGNVLYLSPTIPGGLTNVKPNGSTGHIVVMGYVEYAHANHGKIYVKIMNGWELDELHNVYINNPLNNQGLFYETATQLWKNKSIDTALGYTPVPTTRQLTINGTAYDLSADRSWSVGTVTNIAMTVPTGLTVAGSPITGSGTFALGLQSGYSIPTTANQSNWTTAYNRSIVSAAVNYGVAATSIVLTQQNTGTVTANLIAGAATTNDFVFFNGSNLAYTQLNTTAPLSFNGATKTFSISQAGASTNGFLSSTDWNTFNNKQNAITLTTTGSSGAATLIGSTLNIPNYSSALSGYVPTSRQLTINGTSYDLSADRSWSVGTVTSIGVTAGPRIVSEDGPITSSGNITISHGIGQGLDVQGAQDLMNRSIEDGGSFEAFRCLATSLGELGDFETPLGTFNSIGTVVQNIMLDEFGHILGIGSKTLYTSDIIEDTNLYFTDARARAAISLTTTGTSGAATYNSSTGILNIPQYQSVITNPVTGTGTTNYVPKFTSSSAIGNSALQEVSGNLGLGVTPSAWNTVTAFQVGSTSLGGYSNTGYVNSNAFYQTGWKYVNSSFAARYEINASDAGIHAWFTAPSGTAGNAISFTQAMTLDASGRLGIGTTSPSKRFVVVSPNNDVTTFAGFYAENLSQSVELWYGGIQMGGTNPSVALSLASKGAESILFNTNSSERMRITAAGNVGIGTTTPGDKLTVDGNINSRNTALFFGDGSDNSASVFATGGPVKFFANSSERMRITSAGNVGIGTTSVANAISGTETILKISSSNISSIYLESAGGSIANYLNTARSLVWYDLTAGAERMRITSGGNVGIGTTNPYEVLDVNGNIRLGNYTNAGTRYIGYANNTFANQFIAGMSIESTTVGGNYSQRLNFVTHNYAVDAAVRMTITENGNVGIGTTAPNGKLEVFTGGTSGWDKFVVTNTTLWGDGSTPFVTIGAGGATGIMIANPHIVWNSIANAAALRMGRSGGVSSGAWFEIGTGSNDSFFISRNGYSLTGTTQFFISSNNNVGIGTASPGQKLHIAESNTTSYVASSVSLIQPDGGANILIQNTGGGGFSSLRFVSLNGSNAIGYIGFNNSTASVGGDFVIGQRNGGNSYTEQVRITSAGFVGIGTSSPAAKLTVVGDGSGAALMGSAGFGSNYTGLSLNGTLNTGSYNLLSSPNDNHLYINRPSGNDIYFRMANSDQAVIKNSGLVGIGTTNPDSTLHVNTTGGAVGGIKLTSSTNTNGAAYLAQNAGGTSYFGRNNVTGGSFGGTAYSTVIYSSGAYPMEFYTNDTERMRIAANGNVGIGTTYTDGLISGTEKVLKVSNSNIASIYLESAGNGIWANYINSARSLVWYDITADAERMRITSAGNVGIGTTTPAYKLDVVGDIRLPENNYLYFGNTSNFIRRDSSNILTVAGSSSVYLTTSGSTRVAVMGSGDVGIGTTSPDVKLHVVGTSFVPTTMKLVHSQSFGAPQTLSLSSNSTGVSSLDLSFANPFAINIGGSEMMRIAANGSVGVGTTAPDTSSIMDLSSRRQGFLPPRMTNSEMNSIGSPATGLIVYDTTNNKVTVYNGSSWVPLH